MKKKMYLLMGIAFLTMTLFGCKKAEETVEDQIANKVVESITDVEVSTKGDVTTIETEQGTVDIATDSSESVEIPDGYPQDILPVYDDDHVVVAMDNGEAGYSISAYTKDDFEQVVSFYEDVLEEASVLMQQKDVDFYTSMGELEGYTYTIMIESSDEDDYAYLLTIMAVPGGMGMTGEDGSSEIMDEASSDEKDRDSGDLEHGQKMDLVLTEGVEWPDNYPEDQLPVYPYGLVEAVQVMGDGNQFMLALRLEDPTDSVKAYYEDLLEDAPNYSAMEMSPAMLYGGTIDGVSFSITIMANDGSFGEAENYLTLLQIAYTIE